MVQGSPQIRTTTLRKPLAHHALFRTFELDEAREQVARIFCPHRLDVIGKGRTDACHHHVRGERMSLNYIEYGAKTLISPSALETFYLVQIPLVGGAMIRNGIDVYYSNAKAAAVLNPHRETTMIWEEGTCQVLVQIERAALQSHLCSLVGGQVRDPLTFKGALDLERGVGLQLKNLILHVVSEVDAGRLNYGEPGLMSRQLENTIMTGLIEALPNNYSNLLRLGSVSAAPKHLRLAEAYIEAHLDEPLTIEDIALAANSTPRTLQNAFRKFRDTTPLRYVRDARLSRIHQELLSSDSRASVTSIATRWGFSHFGRFSQVYRQRFGETPITTLRTVMSD